MTTEWTDVDGRTTDDEYETVITDVDGRTKDVEYGKTITTRNTEFCGAKQTRNDTERKLNATTITEITRERGVYGKERTNETMKVANGYDVTERMRTKRALELCTSYERVVTVGKDELAETDWEIHGPDDKLEAVARVIPYKDVEGTFTKFKGDEKENIIEWLDFFDRLCVWAKWDEFYKYVNLLKSLEDTVMGFAKLDGGRDYETLRAVLLRRYGSNVTRGKLLRRMAERKKGRTETVAEYVLDMVRWGRAARLNDREIAEFVVGGVDTVPALKLRLCSIHDLMELQESVEDMERQTIRLNGERGMIRQAGVCWRLRRCVNCGSKEHETDECPVKSLGRKCFNCNRYGHESAFCSEKVQRVMIGANEGPGIVGSITMGVTPSDYKTAKDDCEVEYGTNDRSGSTKEDQNYTGVHGGKMRDGTALDKSEDVNELKERAMSDTVANKVPDEDVTSRSATELNGDDVNRDRVDDGYRTAEGGGYKRDADKDKSKDGEYVDECKNGGEVAEDIIEDDEKSASCVDGNKEAGTNAGERKRTRDNDDYAETNGNDDELKAKVEYGHYGDKAIANEDGDETDLDWKNVKLSGNDSMWDRDDEEAKGDDGRRTVAELRDAVGDSRRDADEERPGIKEISVTESEWVASVIEDRAECGLEDVARVDAFASREDEMRGQAGVMRDDEGQNADVKRVIGNERIVRDNTRMVVDHFRMLKKMKDLIPEVKERWRSIGWELIDSHEIWKRTWTLLMEAYDLERQQQGIDLAPRWMPYELKRLIERSVPLEQLTEEILAEGENGSDTDEGAEQSYSCRRFTSDELREGDCDRMESEAADTGYIEYPEMRDGMMTDDTVAEVGELKDEVDYQRIEYQGRSIVNERATFMMRTFVRCGGAKGNLLIANASGGGELKGRLRERGM